MLGLIFGRKAGLTMELPERLARFLCVRLFGSDLGRALVRGLIVEAVGDVTALASGVLRAVGLLETAAEPGVLSGPNLGVFLAEIRGVASPDRSGSMLFDGVAAASGKIRSSILELLDMRFDMFWLSGDINGLADSEDCRRINEAGVAGKARPSLVLNVAICRF